MDSIIKGIQNLKNKVRRLTMRIESLEKICAKMYYPTISRGIFESVVSNELTDICTRLDALEERQNESLLNGNSDIARKIRRIDVEVSDNRTMHTIRGEQFEKLESRVQVLEEMHKPLMPTKQEIDAFINDYAPTEKKKKTKVDLLDENNFMPSLDEIKGAFGND